MYTNKCACSIRQYTVVFYELYCSSVIKVVYFEQEAFSGGKLQKKQMGLWAL